MGLIPGMTLVSLSKELPNHICWVKSYKKVVQSALPARFARPQRLAFNQRRWDGQTYHALSLVYINNAQSHHASHSHCAIFLCTAHMTYFLNKNLCKLISPPQRSWILAAGAERTPLVALTSRWTSVLLSMSVVIRKFLLN